jgi:hypothetical protein
MTDIVRTAAAYRDRLRSEIARIEQFIRMAEELSRGAETGEASPNLFRTETRSAAATGRPGAERSAAPAARPATPSAPKPSETKAPEFKAPEPKTAASDAPAAHTADPVAPGTEAAETKMPDADPTIAPATEPAPAAPSQSRWGLFRGTSPSPDDLRKAIAG